MRAVFVMLIVLAACTKTPPYGAWTDADTARMDSLCTRDTTPIDPQVTILWPGDVRLACNHGPFAAPDSFEFDVVHTPTRVRHAGLSIVVAHGDKQIVLLEPLLHQLVEPWLHAATLPQLRALIEKNGHVYGVLHGDGWSISGGRISEGQSRGVAIDTVGLIFQSSDEP